MWAIPTGTRSVLKKKKKKNQVKSPSPESCIPETGSDPPIGSDRDSGRDIPCLCGVRDRNRIKMSKHKLNSLLDHHAFRLHSLMYKEN